MRGDLRQSSLADVMRHLYAERKSGILHLSRDGEVKRIHFKKGVAVFADAEDMPPGSRDEAERLLHSLFAWTSGELSFVEGEPTIDETRAFASSPSFVILEGCRRIDDRRTLEHLIGGADSLFACAESSVLPLFTMKLLPEESAILKFARGRERFASKDLPFPSDELPIVRALNALVSVGLLEIAEKAAVSTPTPEAATPPDPTPPQPSDVDALLDAFQAKRTPFAAPIAGASRNPGPDPRVKSVATAVVPEPEPPPPSELEPPVEPAPTTRNAPTPRRIAWIPRARMKSIAVAALAVSAGVAVALGIWLSSRGGASPPPDHAAAATDSSPPPAALEAPGPPSNPREPELATETEPESRSEPSEADLFYSANLAFEKGDYEKSKEELTALLERSPDFAAARELMARVDHELELKPKVVEPPRPPAKVSAPAGAPAPAPKPEPEPAKPAPPDPSELFGEAGAALRRGDLASAEANLDELGRRDASYPGAGALREEIQERLWERKLPLAIAVRHDHALGSCNGTLTLTSNGYAFRSKEHEWVWSFAEVAETERRAPNRLRVETRGHASYNFELKGPLSDEDWQRHQALRNR